MTVNRHGSSCQCTGSQRIVIQSLQRIIQTLNVALEHLEICHEDKTDGNRLCVLQMGKSNGDLVCIFLRFLQNHALQIAQAVQDLIDLFSQIQTGVHLTLIVTASGSMKLLAHIADFLDQTALHTHMDVFIIYVKHDLAVCDLLLDLFKTCNDLVFLFLRYDALLAQHGHMGNTAVDILIVHSLIKKDGRIVFFYKLIHVFLKSSAP